MTQSSLANPSVAESRRASTEPVRVLLVDDNEALLARVAAVLEPGDVVVGAATDGLSAHDAAARSRPNVIVLDISMSGMSGLDVAIRLRKADPHAAIVFLTVHDEEEFVHAARAVGGLGYVLKPRLVSELTHAVHEARRGRPFVSPLIAATRGISPS